MNKQGLQSKPVQKTLAHLLARIQEQHNNPNSYLHRVFPVLPRLLASAPQGAVGSMLHQVFEQAKSNIALYGWLHQQMTGYWPVPRDELNPYQPQQIFEQANALARQHAGSEAGKQLTLSLRSMRELGVVSEIDEKLADTACELWPHHTAVAQSILLSLPVNPSGTRVVDLLDKTNLEDETARELLVQLWVKQAERLDDDARALLTEQVLGKPAIDTENDADAGLSMWLEALADEMKPTLLSLLQNDSLNDEQRRRLWLQAERRAGALGLQFFISVLPTMLSPIDQDGTVRAVLDAEQAVNGIAKSAEERFALGEALSQALLATGSRDTKRRIASWIQTLDAAGAFVAKAKRIGCGVDDVELMREVFPGSKDLKQLAKSAAKPKA